MGVDVDYVVVPALDIVQVGCRITFPEVTFEFGRVGILVLLVVNPLESRKGSKGFLADSAFETEESHFGVVVVRRVENTGERVDAIGNRLRGILVVSIHYRNGKPVKGVVVDDCLALGTEVEGNVVVFRYEVGVPHQFVLHYPVRRKELNTEFVRKE